MHKHDTTYAAKLSVKLNVSNSNWENEPFLLICEQYTSFHFTHPPLYFAALSAKGHANWDVRAVHHLKPQSDEILTSDKYELVTLKYKAGDSFRRWCNATLSLRFGLIIVLVWCAWLYLSQILCSLSQMNQTFIHLFLSYQHGIWGNNNIKTHEI